MSDDLDEQIRRAMKVLDDEVPPGYFEGLPQRTLARLEDGIMQTSSDSSSNRTPSASSPLVVSPMSQKERDEDSGLHDIRSLASTAKARLSSRRSTQSPVATEDDILASSSAGWKAVALPEPAMMVSLPELASLPSKSEIESADRAAREKVKAELKAEKKAAVAAPATALDAPGASTADAPSIGARIAAKPASNKNKMVAFVGIGVAAAAGVGLYFAMSGTEKPAAAVAETRALPKAPELTSTSKTIPTVAPVPTPEPVVAAAPEPVAVAAVAPAATEEKPAAKAAKDTKDKDKVHKVEIRDTVNPEKPAKQVAAVVAPKEEVKAGHGDEPSFDALLKEAGVSEAKKEAKPTLEKKSLSGADIKTGMGSVAGKAQACYAGTQGTAAVKLTVAPSGQVQKVSVTGVFAGTPVASCVEAAVKSATFPPWDGGPQSIAYSYLLAE